MVLVGQAVLFVFLPYSLDSSFIARNFYLLYFFILQFTSISIATYIPIYIHTLYLPNNYTSLFLIPWSSGHIPDQSMRRVFQKKNVMERLFLFSNHTPSNNLVPIDQIPSRMHLHNNDGYRIYYAGHNDLGFNFKEQKSN